MVYLVDGKTVNGGEEDFFYKEAWRFLNIDFYQDSRAVNLFQRSSTQEDNSI